MTAGRPVPPPGAGAAGGEQLSLAGMPRRLFAATPSKLASYVDCPRRYRFSYVDRPIPPKGPPWAHNSLGASVHNALRGWWLLPRERRTPTGAATLLRAGWLTEGFRDAEQSEHWRRTAVEWVRSYVATLDPGDEPPGLERTVSATTERLAVQGRVDRIDARASAMVVVDYKTGRRPPSTDVVRGSPALALYVLGVRRTLRRPCTRVELHHVPSGRIAAWEHTDESLARHVRRAEDVATDILDATRRQAEGATVDEAWPPRPGMHCAWCDFRRHCPAGQAASRPAEPWSGLTSTEAVTDDELD